MADVIADLVAQISIDGSKFTSGIGKVNRQLKTVQEELKTAKSRFQQTGSSTDLLGSKANTLSGKLKLQQSRVDLLNRAYNESKESTGEFSARTQNLATQLEKAKRELGETEHELKEVNAELSKSKWKEYGEQMKNAGDKLQTVGRGMSNFGKSYSMNVTAPIVAGGVAVFKLASDWESAWTGVEKTVDGSAQEMKTLRGELRGMAKDIPATTTEIAGVAEAAGQLGIETPNIKEFTRTMIDLGEATNMTSEQAATEFARFANIVGMSQEDFDRLGSSTVALGNNMATTEAEISEMSLRLAAQGTQVGMSEAQILALAASMSSLGIKAEAGGTAMTSVLKKIDGAVSEGGESLNGFAKAAGVSSSDFSKAWKDDPITALDMFVKGLSKSGEEGENLTTILGKLGIKGIRESDTLLRMAGASDLLSEAVETSTSAWKDNTALTEEAEKRYATTASQLKIMWNHIKDIGITLGEALIPAIMDALDAAEPLIEKIESGAQAFSDMDESQQRTILKLIGLVAAIGPASIVLGGLTTSIGGVLKVGGSLVGMLGKSGGAGLIGRLGMLGMSGPVGIAIASVAGLTLGFKLLSDANEQSIEDTLKSIETRENEIESLDKSIEAFEKLKDKNALTTDEVLRYMDIMSELKDAKTEEGIKKLTDEQEKLLKKSGLTNEEMDKFLELNGIIVEKAPAASKAISDQGNAYADVLEEVKALNEAEKARLLDDTYFALTSEMDKQKQNLNEQKTLQDEIKAKEDERTIANENILGYGRKIKEEDLIIAGIMEEMKTATGDQLIKLEEKLNKHREEKRQLELNKTEEERILEKIQKQIDKKKKKKEQTDKELKQFDELKYKYGALILKEAGLVTEKGKGVEKLNEEQKKLDGIKAKLDEKFKKQKISSSEYKTQNKDLQEQQRKIDGAKQKMEDLNTAAQREIFKDVNVNTNPDIDEMNRKMSYPLFRTINITNRVRGAAMLGYAAGTDNHPGGSFIAGEEGYELGRMGNRWEMLNFGAYDRPSGYEVFTHDESKNIIRALNRMPGYAAGASSPGEANRVVSGLNGNSQEQANRGISEQNRILMAILQSNKNLEKKPILSEGDIKRSYDNRDSRESSKHAIFSGRTGGSY